MLKILPYILPDFDIFESKSSTCRFSLWKPDNLIVVIGQSNVAEKSLIIDNILKDNIPVYKRPSGGQAVVLTPYTLVFSTLFTSDTFENPGKYFTAINDKIIKVLNKIGINNLSQKGISDIAINEKKILGSSIYRRSGKLFYHAVLNVGENAETFEKYLLHPEKEPDYRNGRSHKEFVTSLKEQGYDYEISYFIKIFSEITLNI